MSDIATLSAAVDRIAASVDALVPRIANLEAAKAAAEQAAIIPDDLVSSLNTAADTLDAQLAAPTEPATETPVP